MADSNWIDVCSENDLQPDSGVCALVKGKQVAIFYMPKDNAVYAINNFDPFGKANVLSRGLIGDLNGVPMVSSPLYKQHFDLRTGDCLEDDSMSIEAYHAKIQDGRVVVAL